MKWVKIYESGKVFTFANKIHKTPVILPIHDSMISQFRDRMKKYGFKKYEIFSENPSKRKTGVVNLNKTKQNLETKNESSMVELNIEEAQTLDDLLKEI